MWETKLDFEEGVHYVGFFTEANRWVEDSAHPNAVSAQRRLDQLNGEDRGITPMTDKDKAVRAAELLNQCNINTDLVNVFVNELEVRVQIAMKEAANN